MARPKKSEEDKTVPIYLERKFVAMLDSYIERQLQEQWILNGGLKNNTPAPTRIMFANARRHYLGEIIEGKLGVEAQHPDKIKIIAPVAGHHLYFYEAAEWLRREEKRLEQEAPEPIKIALQSNKEILEWWKKSKPMRAGLLTKKESTMPKGPKDGLIP